MRTRQPDRLSDPPTRNTRVFLAVVPVVVLAYQLMPESNLRAFVPVLVPVALMVAATIRREAPLEVFHEFGIALFLSYVALVLFGFFLSQEFDFSAARKALLPTTGLSIAAFRYRVSDVALFRFALFLFAVGILLGSLITGPGADTNLTSLLSSNWATESVFGVALGGITVVLLARKRPGLALVIFALSIVLAKRNSIFGAFVVSLTFLTFALFLGRDLALRFLRATLPLLAIGMFVLSWNLMSIFETVANAMSGVNAQMISTGRYWLYYTIIKTAEVANFTQFLLGHGTGSIERLIASNNHINPNITLAHSEYLSLYFDFGVIGVILFFAMLIRFAWASLENVLLVMFVLVIAPIENYLSVTFVLMTFAFMLSASRPLANDDTDARPA